MGVLTRQEMEKAINEGGSVLYKERLISRVADLPSEADLAAGDPAAEQAALGSLQAQMGALQAQMEQLSRPAAVAEPKTSKK